MGLATDLRGQLQDYGVKGINYKTSYDILKEAAARAKYLREQDIKIKNMDLKRLEQAYEEQKRSVAQQKAQQLKDPNYLRTTYGDTLYLVSSKGDEWGRDIRTTTPEKFASSDYKYKDYRIVSKTDYENWQAKNESKTERTQREQSREKQAAEDLATKQELLKKSGMAYDIESAKKAVLVSPEEYQKVVAEKAAPKQDNYYEMLGKVQEGLAISAKNIEEMKTVAPEYKSALQELQSGAMGGAYTVTPSGGLIVGTSPEAMIAVEQITKEKKAVEEQKAFETMFEKVQTGLAASQARIDTQKKILEETPTVLSAAPKKILEATGISATKLPIFTAQTFQPMSMAPPKTTTTDISSKIGIGGITGGSIFGGDKKYTFYTATDIGGLKAEDAVPKKLSTTDPMGIEKVRQRLCDDNYTCKTYDVTYKSGQVTDLTYVPKTQLTEYDWEAKRKDSLSNIPENVLKELQTPYEDPYGKYKFTVTDSGINRYEVPKTPGIWGKLPDWMTPAWVKKPNLQFEPVTVQPGAMDDITGRAFVAGMPSTQLVNEQKVQALTGVGMRGITGATTVAPKETTITSFPNQFIQAFGLDKVSNMYDKVAGAIPTLLQSTIFKPKNIPVEGVLPTLDSYSGYNVLKDSGIFILPDKLISGQTVTIPSGRNKIADFLGLDKISNIQGKPPERQYTIPSLYVGTLSAKPPEYKPSDKEYQEYEKRLLPQISTTPKFFFKEKDKNKEVLRVTEDAITLSTQLSGRRDYLLGKVEENAKTLMLYNEQLGLAKKDIEDYKVLEQERNTLKPIDYEKNVADYNTKLNIYNQLLERKPNINNYNSVISYNTKVDESYNELKTMESELKPVYEKLQPIETKMENLYKKIISSEPTSKQKSIMFEPYRPSNVKQAEKQNIEIEGEIRKIDELLGVTDEEGNVLIQGVLPSTAISSIEKLQAIDPFYTKHKDIAKWVDTSTAPGPFDEISRFGEGFKMSMGVGALESGRNILLGTTIEPYRTVQRDVKELGFAGTLKRDIAEPFIKPSAVPGTAPMTQLWSRSLYDPYEALTPSEQKRLQEIKNEGTWFQKGMSFVLPGYETKLQTKALEGDITAAFMLYGGLAAPATKALPSESAAVNIARTAWGGIKTVGGYSLLAGPPLYEAYKGITGKQTLGETSVHTGDFAGKVLATIGGISTLRGNAPPVLYKSVVQTPKGEESEAVQYGLGWKLWGDKQYVGGPLIGIGRTGPGGAWRPNVGTPTGLKMPGGQPVSFAAKEVNYLTYKGQNYYANPYDNTVTIGKNSYQIYGVKGKIPNPVGKGQITITRQFANIKGKPYEITQPIKMSFATKPEQSILLQVQKEQGMNPAYEAARQSYFKAAGDVWTVSGKETPGQVTVQELKSMSKADAQLVDSELYKLKSVLQHEYGSGVTKGQLGEWAWERARGLGGLPGDKDVATWLSEKDAHTVAIDIAGKMKTAGSTKFIDVKVPKDTSLIQTKVFSGEYTASGKPIYKWINAVDIHPLSPSATELSSTSMTGSEPWGYKYSPYTYQVPLTPGSKQTLPVSTLGRQVIAEGASMYTPRTGYGGEAIYSPELYRLKDIPTGWAALERAAQIKMGSSMMSLPSDATKLGRTIESGKSYFSPELFPKEAQTTLFITKEAKPATPWLQSPTTFTTQTGFPKAIWSIEDYYATKGIRTAPTIALPKQPTFEHMILPPAPSPSFGGIEYFKPSESSMSASLKNYLSGSSPYVSSPSTSGFNSYISSMSPSSSVRSASQYTPSQYISPPPPPPPYDDYRGSDGSGGSLPPYSPLLTPSKTIYTGPKWPGIPSGGVGFWPQDWQAGMAGAGIAEWTVTNPIRDLPGEWLAAQKMKDITELSGVGLSSGLIPRVTPFTPEIVTGGQGIMMSGGKLSHKHTRQSHMNMHMNMKLPNLKMPHMNMGMPHMNMGAQYINVGMPSFNFKQPKQEIQVTGYDRAKSAVNKMFNAEGLSDRKIKMLTGRGKHGKIL